MRGERTPRNLEVEEHAREVILQNQVQTAGHCATGNDQQVDKDHFLHDRLVEVLEYKIQREEGCGSHDGEFLRVVLRHLIVLGVIDKRHRHLLCENRYVRSAVDETNGNEGG